MKDKKNVYTSKTSDNNKTDDQLLTDKCLLSEVRDRPENKNIVGLVQLRSLRQHNFESVKKKYHQRILGGTYVGTMSEVARRILLEKA